MCAIQSDEAPAAAGSRQQAAATWASRSVEHSLVVQTWHVPTLLFLQTTAAAAAAETRNRHSENNVTHTHGSGRVSGVSMVRVAVLYS